MLLLRQLMVGTISDPILNISNLFMFSTFRHHWFDEIRGNQLLL